jgi:hypothetical protein
MTTWCPKNKKHYESRSYFFTKYKNEFEVKVEDLPDSSNMEVEIKCDECGKILKNVTWVNYKRCVKKDSKYYCQKCATKIFSIKKGLQTKFKNSKSFEEWCIKNNKKDVLDRWDYELNDCKPNEITYGTKNKYYFKCPKEKHESELKTINSFTRGQEGSINCNKCNSFAQWGIDIVDINFLDNYWDYSKNKINPWDISYGNHNYVYIKCQKNKSHESYVIICKDFIRGNRCPICNGRKVIKGINDTVTMYPNLLIYFVNKKDAEKYPPGTHKKVPMKCPRCEYIRNDITINHLTTKGFICPRCGDGFSYPEKFMFNILEQLNINFKFQLNKTIFKWCNKYKYDFYIENINCIIETHGMQHYKETTSKWNDLIEIQVTDKYKKSLAKENRITNYIVIDCRYSELEYIKNNILNSKLADLFDLSKINWLRCHEFACSSLVKTVCGLWESEINNTLEISNKLKIGRNTVIRYLKQGVKLGWCNYDPKEQKTININNKCKSVICLTTNEIFDTISNAEKKYNIRHISDFCRGKTKSAGKHPETGEKLVWMYYEDYLKQQITA